MMTATTEGTTAATIMEVFVFDFGGEAFPDNELFDGEAGVVPVDEAPTLAPDCPSEEVDEDVP